jgi:hypothetical protein
MAKLKEETIRAFREFLAADQDLRKAMERQKKAAQEIERMHGRGWFSTPIHVAVDGLYVSVVRHAGGKISIDWKALDAVVGKADPVSPGGPDDDSDLEDEDDDSDLDL